MSEILSVRLCGLQQLEDRLTPAITFRFDYRFDALGFFSDPARRELLEQTAATIGSRLDADLAAITPTSANTWSANVYQPLTQSWVSIDQFKVNADELVVFVGGANAVGDEVAYATTGGWQGRGTNSWLNTLATRNHAGYANWGGSIGFDIGQPWNFNPDSHSVRPGDTDFVTVVNHELGHILGFGTSSQFKALVQGTSFLGTQAFTAYGSTPQLDASLSHWAQGTTLAGINTSLQPVLVSNSRYTLSELDYAVLADIGWTVTHAATVALEPTIAPLTQGSHVVVWSGGPSGTIQLAVESANGYTASGKPIRPFADFGGVVRGVSADFNGDGIPDFAFGTGPGGGSRLRIINGQTFADLVPVTSAFETTFRGGVYLATADLNNDGNDELIVAPDNGGGGRISAFEVRSGSLQTVANFFAIEDPNFRGGARVATGDINGDGRPDLIVGAGYGGGPRVALFDGRALYGAQKTPAKLRDDFFAFPGEDSFKLRNGVFVAAGDLNGDGRAELVFGAGPGGGPRVLAYDAQVILSQQSQAPLAILSNFFAYAETDRGGVRVTVQDGKILASTGQDGQGLVREFDHSGKLLDQTTVWNFVLNGIDVG